MTEIIVRKINDDNEIMFYEVEVRDGGGSTKHKVEVSEGYYKQVAGDSISPEVLVQKSFEFLLERESKESILSSFKLSVISRYFPQYEREIKKYF